MKKKLLFIAFAGFLMHCATVPITGRKQVKLLPTGQMMGLSFSQYEEVKKSTPLLPDSDPRTQLVKSVGAKISVAVNTFLSENGYKDRLSEFEWEFNLSNEDIVNAWCMPGGKVMFYTGILPICDGEEGIATVMGHEIAHAIARHGNERMSQQMIAQGIGTGLGVYLSEKPEAAQQLFMTAFGAGTQVGMLKFSRDNESEADKLGLVFMTMAGYNPEAAVSFWQRMSANSGGQAPPEFLSTHPSDKRRISDIQSFLPEARKYGTKK
jgi:predicted Zn-dependent protease